MEIKVNVVMPPHNILQPFTTSRDLDAILTDEHVSCSYGLPVVLIQGKPYGHSDLMCINKDYQVVVCAEYTNTEPVERITTPEQKEIIDRAELAGYQVYKY